MRRVVIFSLSSLLSFAFPAAMNSTEPIQKNTERTALEKLAQSSDDEADKAFWEVIEGSDDIELYESYLKWFPNGQFVSRAKSEIERLKGKKQVEVPKPVLVESFKDCDVCPEMVVIPAGSFMMGSPDGEEGRSFNEGPQHRVTISKSFAVGIYEVTFAEWDACVADGGCRQFRNDSRGWGRGNRPVINISWKQAKSYVAWLASKTGKAYRLLTEAEWEYVARANTQTPFWWGATISTDQANYNGQFTYGSGEKAQYRKKTVPGDKFQPNDFGLYNIHGNVWEWVEDCWHDNYDGAPTDGSAWLEANNGNCDTRVLRGGSWGNSPWYLRSANRGWNSNSQPWLQFNIGFRVARSLD